MSHPKIFLVAVTALITIPSAQATDPDPGTPSTPPRPITATQKALAVPKAAAGVFAGLTIGVPIKITKDIHHEIRRYAGTARGDMGNEFGFVENIFVATTSIPYGLLSGFIMGGIRGTERAITYGSRQPFSKESLGLVDPPAREEEKDPTTVVQK